MKKKPWEVLGEDGLPLQMSIDLDYEVDKQPPKRRAARTVHEVLRQAVYSYYDYLMVEIKRVCLDYAEAYGISKKDFAKACGIAYRECRKICLAAISPSYTFHGLMSSVIGINKDDFSGRRIHHRTKAAQAIARSLWESERMELKSYYVDINDYHYMPYTYIVYMSKSWNKSIRIRFEHNYIPNLIRKIVIGANSNGFKAVHTILSEEEIMKNVKGFFSINIDVLGTVGTYKCKQGNVPFVNYLKLNEKLAIKDQLRSKWKLVDTFKVYTGYLPRMKNLGDTRENAMLSISEHTDANYARYIKDYFVETKVNLYKLTSGGYRFEINGDSPWYSADFVAALSKSRDMGLTIDSLQEEFERDLDSCGMKERVMNGMFIPLEQRTSSKYYCCAKTMLLDIPSFRRSRYSQEPDTVVIPLDTISDETISLMSGRGMKDALKGKI